TAGCALLSSPARRSSDLARAAGARVSFDGNFRPKLWQAWNGDAASILRELMAEADVLFADHRDMGVVLGGAYPQDEPRQRVGARSEEHTSELQSREKLVC